MNDEIWMIDPPQGWKYGFPKKLNMTELKHITFEEWLVKNGYPEEDVDFATQYCRRWKPTTEEEKNK